MEWIRKSSFRYKATDRSKTLMNMLLVLVSTVPKQEKKLYFVMESFGNCEE